MKGKCLSNRFYTTSFHFGNKCGGRGRAKRSHKTVLPVPAHTDFNFLSTWIDNEVGELIENE